MRPSRLCSLSYPTGTKRIVLVLFAFTCNLLIAVAQIPNSASIQPATDHINRSYSNNFSAIGNLSQELPENSRNCTIALDQNDHSIFEAVPQTNFGEKKVSDFADEQFSSSFFSGDSGEAQRKQLEKITDTLHRLRQARDNPQVLEAHQALKLYLWKEIQQAETLLETMRAWLIRIFDQKDLNPEQFKSAKELKKGLRAEEEVLWDDIWKSEEEDYRFKKKSQGFFGYFYSLSKFFFDNQYWEKQQLRQSLRKILSQLPHRILMEEERVIMQLEKVQKAGFQISWQEQRLARKISEMSQNLSLTDSEISCFIPLDVEEGNLLETIGHRTVAVRREEQVHGLEGRLKKTLKDGQLHGIDSEDQKFILNELQELIKKEKDGLGWTEEDAAWMQSLEKESKNLEKKKKGYQLHQLVATLKIKKFEQKQSRLRQIATDLQLRKAFNVLQANAHDPMSSEKLALRLKLAQKLQEYMINSPSKAPPHEELTEPDIKEIKQLARHYYRMKEQLKFPLHPDLKEVVRKQLDKEVLSPEKAAIHRLNQLKHDQRIEPSQQELLDKLEHGIMGHVVAIGPEEVRVAEEHRKRRLAVPQSDKAKEVERLLHGTPEHTYLLQQSELDKVELYNKAIHSTPLWEFRNENKPKEAIKHLLNTPSHTGQPDSDHSPHSARFLTFAERCKVLIHSQEFRIHSQEFRAHSNTSPESLEQLAFKRLHQMQVNPAGAEIHDSLASNRDTAMSTTEAKEIIKNLALKEHLVRTFRPAPEDAKLAKKLSANIKLANLNKEALGKLQHLLPDELNELGKLIPLIGEIDKNFKKSAEFFQIVGLLQKASDRIRFRQSITHNDRPINLLFHESTLEATHHSLFLKHISRIKHIYNHFEDSSRSVLAVLNVNLQATLGVEKTQAN
ncbi:hypothetical protein PTTG_27303 [Puccinia triticina 1-1 BBBD Race 1]|uniref:Uncharacterized protein n=2 Tax=Puccinia triticina TaxID=208348 RepID=A0A180GM23_PUCT1|nr:uncharacterized protein PtA15_3A588 [Puccinia triticina]OAV93518.1 hypothetical protein PTTG_27303 [Puccinia triticina 1-1 BBBD Race 1]WAQ83219.1 hypothetical protein PtA15_3A588 [Puccinia triticina]